MGEGGGTPGGSGVGVSGGVGGRAGSGLGLSGVGAGLFGSGVDMLAGGSQLVGFCLIQCASLPPVPPIPMEDWGSSANPSAKSRPPVAALIDTSRFFMGLIASQPKDAASRTKRHRDVKQVSPSRARNVAQMVVNSCHVIETRAPRTTEI